MSRSIIPSAVARAAFGFDPTELLLMTRPLAEVVRRLAEDDRATVPPPRPAI